MKFLTLILALVSLNSFAGKGGGNGADAIVCYDKPLYKEVVIGESYFNEKLSDDELINRVKIFLQESEDYKQGRLVTVDVQFLSSPSPQKREVKVKQKIIYSEGEEPKLTSAELLDLWVPRNKGNKYKLDIYESEEQKQKIEQELSQIEQMVDGSEKQNKLNALVEERAVYVLQRLADKGKDLTRSQRLIKRLTDKSVANPLYYVKKGSVPNAKDSSYNLRDHLGEKCYEAPLAYQQPAEEISHGDAKVLIVGEIYNNPIFSFEDKVGTLLHELYLEDDISFNGLRMAHTRNSDRIRPFTYLSMSNFVSESKGNEYFQVLKPMELVYYNDIYEINGVELIVANFQVSSFYLNEDAEIESEAYGKVIKASKGSKVALVNNELEVVTLSSPTLSYSSDFHGLEYEVKNAISSKGVKEPEYEMSFHTNKDKRLEVKVMTDQGEMILKTKAVEFFNEKNYITLRAYCTRKNPTSISFEKEGIEYSFKTERKYHLITDLEVGGSSYISFSFDKETLKLKEVFTRDNNFFWSLNGVEYEVLYLTNLDFKNSKLDTITNTGKSSLEFSIKDGNRKVNHKILEGSSLSIKLQDSLIKKITSSMAGFRVSSWEESIDSEGNEQTLTYNTYTYYYPSFNCDDLILAECKATEESVSPAPAPIVVINQYIYIQGQNLFAREIEYYEDGETLKSAILDYSDIGESKLSFLDSKEKSVKIKLKKQGRVYMTFNKNGQLVSFAPKS